MMGRIREERFRRAQRRDHRHLLGALGDAPDAVAHRRPGRFTASAQSAQRCVIDQKAVTGMLRCATASSSAARASAELLGPAAPVFPTGAASVSALAALGRGGLLGGPELLRSRGASRMETGYGRQRGYPGRWDLAVPPHGTEPTWPARHRKPCTERGFANMSLAEMVRRGNASEGQSRCPIQLIHRLDPAP